MKKVLKKIKMELSYIMFEIRHLVPCKETRNIDKLIKLQKVIGDAFWIVVWTLIDSKIESEDEEQDKQRLNEALEMLIKEFSCKPRR